MSVLIKGMEMPKSCDECRIMVFEDTNCVPELFCGCPIVFMAHPQGVGHRPDYCPLVEVPKHGRLIDADCCNGYFYEHMSDDMMIAAMNAINEMPTIIESEDGDP